MAGNNPEFTAGNTDGALAEANNTATVSAQESRIAVLTQHLTAANYKFRAIFGQLKAGKVVDLIVDGERITIAAVPKTPGT